MKITIIKTERKEKRYARVELEEFCRQLTDGTYHYANLQEAEKQVCFAAEWQKQNGELQLKNDNRLILLSLENLQNMDTVNYYKRLAEQQLYTLLAFLGHDGHSLHIVCRYDVATTSSTDSAEKKPTAPEHARTALLNAFRKLHYIYASQLQTAPSTCEPTLETCCPVSYDPQPYYNPAAIAVSVTDEPEQTPEFRAMQEAISDYALPEEIPGMSVQASRIRRFHDCLNAAIESCRDIKGDSLFATAVLEQLADGCRQMGLPQAFCAHLATYIPLLGGTDNRETIETVFRTAYLRETLKAIPLKYTSPMALITYKTEAYMNTHYTLRLNVMTGTPEYRKNAVGHGFQPLSQSVRNTMSIMALKAGIESWDKDLNRYIDSEFIPRYYPMEDFLKHLPQWDGRHDYVGELARRVKTDNRHWEEDFHRWMLSMVAQWTGKNLQYGNSVVPLLIGPQGSGKTTFCRRLLPEYLQMYYSDRLSMKNDNDIYIAMSSYALINLDEFDALKKSQQPILKYLLTKHDVKFRPPYGRVMEQRQRLASFIATTNNLRPLTDPTGSRRFICIYADETDNSGNIRYDQLYAQLYQELNSGRRYWFEADDNKRIMEQNQPFQQVTNPQLMISQTFLPADETPADASYLSLAETMQILARRYPTFTIQKNTDKELGRRLHNLGYEHKKSNKGIAYKMATRPA